MTTITPSAPRVAVRGRRSSPPLLRRLRLKRRVVQWLFLAALLLPPLLGWWRIDLAGGSVEVGGWRVLWGDAGILAPVAALLLSLLAALAVGYGLVWCGWLCPQNTLSELVDSLIRRLLGRHQAVGLGEVGKPRPKVNTAVRWAAFAAVVGGLSLVGAVLLASWFLPLPTVLSGMGLGLLQGSTGRGAPNLYWLVAGLAALIALDLAVLRHFWCRWLCPYSVWSFLLWGRDTLRVGFDSPREHDCVGCGACVRSCYMGVDPRQPESFSRCINCGECVIACREVQFQFDRPSLLEFTLTPVAGPQAPQLPVTPLAWWDLASRPTRRMLWPVAAAVASVLVLGVGLAGFQPLRLEVAAAPGSQLAAAVSSYTVDLQNLGPTSTLLSLEAVGVPDGSAHFSAARIRLAGGERAHLLLGVGRVGSLAGAGAHTFTVVARDSTGRVVARQQAVFVGALN